MKMEKIAIKVTSPEHGARVIKYDEERFSKAVRDANELIKELNK